MTKTANVERVYGPMEHGTSVNGVEWDGERLWFGSSAGLAAIDPRSGEIVRKLDVPGDAGTAFDGRHLWQIVEDRIVEVDPSTGAIVSTIPAPGSGRDSGLTWAEGKLWVGQYRDRKILRVDPKTGAVERTIVSDRFVTGVTWHDGELWHAVSDEGTHELRRVDPETGDVLDRLEAPDDVPLSGLATDGRAFYCGGGRTRVIRKLVRP
jgi:streptogramin lyase